MLESGFVVYGGMSMNSNTYKHTALQVCVSMFSFLLHQNDMTATHEGFVNVSIVRQSSETVGANGSRFFGTDVGYW